MIASKDFLKLLVNMVRVILLLNQETKFRFLQPKYRQNISYRQAPKRNCQPMIGWPKNQRKIGKIVEISEILDISAKFQNFISCAHVLEFLKKYW